MCDRSRFPLKIVHINYRCECVNFHGERGKIECSQWPQSCAHRANKSQRVVNPSSLFNRRISIVAQPLLISSSAQSQCGNPNKRFINSEKSCCKFNSVRCTTIKKMITIFFSSYFESLQSPIVPLHKCVV